MDDATGQLGGNGTEISDLVPRKNGVRFAISKMSELPPRGGNSDIDTVYFTLPFLMKILRWKSLSSPFEEVGLYLYSIKRTHPLDRSENPENLFHSLFLFFVPIVFGLMNLCPLFADDLTNCDWN